MLRDHGEGVLNGFSRKILVKIVQIIVGQSYEVSEVRTTQPIIRKSRSISHQLDMGQKLLHGLILT